MRRSAARSSASSSVPLPSASAWRAASMGDGASCAGSSVRAASSSLNHPLNNYGVLWC
jgi:hypothetical protein